MYTFIPYDGILEPSFNGFESYLSFKGFESYLSDRDLSKIVHKIFHKIVVFVLIL